MSLALLLKHGFKAREKKYAPPQKSARSPLTYFAGGVQTTASFKT
jgi:hypothetical protein